MRQARAVSAALPHRCECVRECAKNCAAAIYAHAPTTMLNREEHERTLCIQMRLNGARWGPRQVGMRARARTQPNKQTNKHASHTNTHTCTRHHPFDISNLDLYQCARARSSGAHRRTVLLRTGRRARELCYQLMCACVLATIGGGIVLPGMEM